MVLTGNDILDMLNKRMQTFIRNSLKWKDFTEIQKKTIPYVLNGEDVLVIGPTASGKTESVLIPVFNNIKEENLEPMSVLYISPLKALINDMYNRINKWGEYFNISCTKWHGDVSKYKKDKFIKEPTDFLLITPESLEVILFNKSFEKKKRIFKNIKYVIIDEVHYFVESERGTQLNSLLSRISQYCKNEFIRLGLSATVGNPEYVASWLNHKKQVTCTSMTSNSQLYYKLLLANEQTIQHNLKDSIINKEKTLFFAKSRLFSEGYYWWLKNNLNYKNLFIHHSSIDKSIKEENEHKFKIMDDGIMINTSTLELGIDIGDIFSVYQLEPPFTISSLLQRVGRSGRKNKIRLLKLFYKDPYDFFICLSELSLAYEDIVEDLKIPDKPKDIYFHQILSTIKEYTKITEKDLYYILNDCFVFKNITFEEFKNIIEYLKSEEFIHEYYDYLKIGNRFNKKFGKNGFVNFYSVFCSITEYTVRQNQRVVGSLDPFFSEGLHEGSLFVLSGLQWKILKIDHEKLLIDVVKNESLDDNIPIWFTDRGIFNYEIARQVWNIILGNFDKKLLTKENCEIKNRNIYYDFSKEAEKLGLKNNIIPISIEGKDVVIHTYAGDKVNFLLGKMFEFELQASIMNSSAFNLHLTVGKDITPQKILNLFKNIESIYNSLEFRLFIEEQLKDKIRNKFIRFLPLNDRIELQMKILFDIEHLKLLLKENKLQIYSDMNMFNSLKPT